MLRPIFITGIGTAIGKTVIAAIVTEALQADYWKPVQAGFDDGTDSLKVKNLISNHDSRIFPEAYKLKLPASPHLAARNENVQISLEEINRHFYGLSTVSELLIIEGAGGIMVPLNENEFVIDLIRKLNAKVILVSRNYLGSINHSLLTASICTSYEIDVIGWVFNDHYMNYEDEIVSWSGFPKIISVPQTKELNKKFVQEQAENMRERLLELM